MPEAVRWSLIIFGIPIATAVSIVLIARLWQHRERTVLIVASALGCLCIGVGGCAVFAVGGHDARLTVSNQSAWPATISAEGYASVTVTPGRSDELFSAGNEPVRMIDGLIQDAFIVGGPDGATRIELGDLAGQAILVTITDETVKVTEQGPVR